LLVVVEPVFSTGTETVAAGEDFADIAVNVEVLAPELFAPLPAMLDVAALGLVSPAEALDFAPLDAAFAAFAAFAPADSMGAAARFACSA
jgi:hypothetical protein